MQKVRLEGKLVLASHNRGKAGEIAALLAPLKFDVLRAWDLGLPEPEETGETYAENAALKAVAAAEASGLPALADDSGLDVFALGGAPGVLTARWAGPDRDFALAMGKVEAALEASGSTDRSARFVSVLALARPGQEALVFEGEVRGTLVWPPRGHAGFGFDPMFVPDGCAATFAELPPADKIRLSHRTRAFEKLLAALT